MMTKKTGVNFLKLPRKPKQDTSTETQFKIIVLALLLTMFLSGVIVILSLLAWNALNSV